ncbi:Uncharacterised protein [Anaerotruncus sp. 2789STDY5834896]|uniref:Uncharacterized protein n=1 Tax=uncultured Anaerotruncus sp. TaxID=905011 RepID=A0A1C6JAM3_9FIRM|nr:Uncharacterised protein [uncultured Anaerotruncus sp.]
MEEKTCRIPVQATYEIQDGQAVLVSAQYEDIPADLIARFLIEKCGRDAIFKGVSD